MTENIHHTFRNIAADQTFNIDAVIGELQRLRESHLHLMSARVTRMQELIEAGKPSSQVDSSPAPNAEAEFYALHDALIVANEMNRKGERTIVLNTKESLPDQILAKATRELLGLGLFRQIDALSDAARLRLSRGKMSPS